MWVTEVIASPVSLLVASACGADRRPLFSCGASCQVGATFFLGCRSLLLSTGWSCAAVPLYPAQLRVRSLPSRLARRQQTALRGVLCTARVVQPFPLVGMSFDSPLIVLARSGHRWVGQRRSARMPGRAVDGVPAARRGAGVVCNLLPWLSGLSDRLGRFWHSDAMCGRQQ